MVEDLPNVPPALVMLARELRACASWAEMRRRTKSMLKDLREQSEAFELENVRESRQEGSRARFEVHLHGALNLLSGDGCQELQCRIAAADRVARSVGLIADRLWLTDLLTERVVNLGRPTNAKLDVVIGDVIVAARLMPLIRAGVVRFRSPLITVCSSCLGSFESSVANAATEVAKRFLDEFKFEKNAGGGVSFHVGSCIEPTVILRLRAWRPNKATSRRQFIESWIARELRSTLWTAREASLTGGAVFSNSRIGLAGLLQCDGRLGTTRTLRVLDQRRSFTLPWVSELNAEQIVQLREESAAALPLLREKLCSAMTASSSGGDAQGDGSAIIAELREQAAEVRAELDAKRRTAGRFWKGTFGILGLGLSAYGVATDQIVPGVGGILPILQLLIQHKAGFEADVAKLESRPGIVLVKAQEILSHADADAKV